MLPKLPGDALRILNGVAAAGGRAYLVGGALRDLMMGNPPAAWDFAASLPAADLLAIFPGAKPVGGAAGTVRVRFGEGYCDITPCRTEGGYGGRRPSQRMDFMPDILADLARRDFTMNAMAYDGQVLLDPFGGQRDLKRRQLRCVGDPDTCFAGSALRVLRLFRFAATLGFTVGPASMAAANARMEGLATLSGEAVRGELEQILLCDAPRLLSPLIAHGGLQRFGFFFAPSLLPLGETPRDPLCRWWALAALCGVPTDVLAERLEFPRRFATQLAECTALYRRGPAADKIAMKRKLRNFQADYAPLSATFAAVSPAFAGEPVLYAGIRLRREPYRLRDLAVKGDLLVAEGISGPRCGQMLEELLDAVIQNPALNKQPVLLGLARGLSQMQ